MLILEIVSLNIQHGGGKRINHIIEYFDTYCNEADIFIICEYRSNINGTILNEYFRSIDCKYQYFDENVSRKSNGIYVASKIEFEKENLSSLLGDESKRIMKLHNSLLTLFPVYFANHNKKKTIFEFIMNEKFDLNGRIVLMGDFNTGLPFFDEKGETFWGASYFKKITDMGFIDCYRSIYGNKTEFSWYSNKGNGFRIDHAFITSKYNNEISACHYDSKPRNSKISDHSLMRLDLKIK